MKQIYVCIFGFRSFIIRKLIMDERYLSFGEEKKYKFILVGDSNVGKTALFWRFV